MDREGFNIIDKQYQEELATAKRKAQEKWEQEYSKKEYVGTPEMQTQARAAMQTEMQQHIDEEVAGYEQQIGQFHYGDGGRDAVLKELERAEKEAAYEQRLNEHFNQQQTERDSADRGR